MAAVEGRAPKSKIIVESEGVLSKSDLMKVNSHIEDLEKNLNRREVSFDEIKVSIYEDGNGKYLFSLRVKKDRTFLVKATRKITVGKTLTHSLLLVDEGLQGKGVAKDVLRLSLDLADTFNLQKINLSAALDNGAYSWLRYGWFPNDKKKLSSIFAQAVKEDKLTSKQKEFWDSLSTREQRAFVLTDEFRVYKQALLGKKWSGSIDLTDPKSRAIIEGRVTKAKPPSNPDLAVGPDLESAKSRPDVDLRPGVREVNEAPFKLTDFPQREIDFDNTDDLDFEDADIFRGTEIAEELNDGNISNLEKKALRNYTDAERSFVLINEVEREGNTQGGRESRERKQARKIGEQLRATLAESRVNKPVVLYRGASNLQYKNSDIKKGAILQWQGFTSTSLSQQVGEEFAGSPDGRDGGILYQIKASTKVRGLRFIGDISQMPDQYEVLINTDAKFRVVKDLGFPKTRTLNLKGQKPVRVVELELLDDSLDVTPTGVARAPIGSTITRPTRPPVVAPSRRPSPAPSVSGFVQPKLDFYIERGVVLPDAIKNKLDADLQSLEKSLRDKGIKFSRIGASLVNDSSGGLVFNVEALGDGGSLFRAKRIINAKRNTLTLDSLTISETAQKKGISDEMFKLNLDVIDGLCS